MVSNAKKLGGQHVDQLKYALSHPVGATVTSKTGQKTIRGSAKFIDNALRPVEVRTVQTTAGNKVFAGIGRGESTGKLAEKADSYIAIKQTEKDEVKGGINPKINYDYNMIENPGPLAELKDNPASNFVSGKYNIKVLEEDTILYRSGKKGGLTIAGQEKNALGQWFTREPAESVAKVRIDSAVKAQWIDPKTGVLTGTSPIESTYAIKIPKGTTIYEGPVGYQGSSYLGGESCNQIFVSEPWKITELEVLKESKIQ